MSLCLCVFYWLGSVPSLNLLFEKVRQQLFFASNLLLVETDCKSYCAFYYVVVVDPMLCVYSVCATAEAAA